MVPYIDFRSEYCALRNAIHRCYKLKNKQYSDYGGRGITVCDDWRTKDGFHSFFAHIGPKASPDLTLDRIDNNGNYEPGNVRWASRQEQTQNTRANLRAARFTISGETKTILEWSKHTGIPYATLVSRIKKGLTGVMLITPQPIGRKPAK